EAVLRQPPDGAAGAKRRAKAAAAYFAAARTATNLASGDGTSQDLIAAQVGAQNEARRLAPKGASTGAAGKAARIKLPADLERAQARIEEERARLAITIESLGDALLVAEPDGTISATNPRAAELVPGLEPGSKADEPDSPLPALEDALAGELQTTHGERTL